MSPNAPVDELVAGVRAGDARALGRAISLAELGGADAAELLRRLYPDTGRAHIVGLTGAPGAGKSTLVSALVGVLRARGLTVGVVSVDPSSPFTRGAVLGDRIRLVDHFLDEGVFIRSMGTRGHAGGLAEATLAATLVLDAAGKDVILLETVGTGQSEIGIVSVADTIVLALMAGSGDAVQALKAGVMEIPDVIAVTKGDHPSARAAVRDVRAALSVAETPAPPVLLTDALHATGVEELWEELARLHAAQASDGQLAERRGTNLVAETLALVATRARRQVEEQAGSDPELGAVLERVRAREVDPVSAVAEIVRIVFGRS